MADTDGQLIEGVETAAPESSGLPQLAADDWAPQLVWLLISFVFLYVMMSRVALPKIGLVIEERRDKIADDLDRAAELKQEAEDALTAYEQALTEARNKALGIAGETRDRVKAETDQLKAETDAKINARIAEAETKIKAAKDEALSNVQSIAAGTAQVIVDKLVGKSIDDATANAAVAAELKNS